MTIVFDPLAKREYEDAVEYYEAQEAGLGDKFRGAVVSAIAILERFPEIGEESWTHDNCAGSAMLYR